MVAGKQQKRPAQVHELPPTAAAVALAALRDAPMPQIDHPLFRASLESHRDFLEEEEKKHDVVICSSPAPAGNGGHDSGGVGDAGHGFRRRHKIHRLKITSTVRNAVISAVIGENTDRDAVARSMKLKKTTVNSIIRQFRKTGRTYSLRRGGARESIEKYDAERLRVVIKNYLCGDPNFPWEKRNPYYTNFQIRQRLLDDFPYDSSMQPSVEWIGAVSREIGLTYKEPVRLPRQRNNPENKEIRRDWVTWASTHIFPDNVIYIDECSFELHMHPRKGRSMIGDKVYQDVNGAAYHEGKLTAVMAVSPTLGVVYGQSIIGSFDKVLFIKFIDRLCHTLGSSKSFMLIYDNAPIHKTPELENLINSYGHTMKRLPPYSPFLNPIEECFSLWKQGVRKRQTDNNAALQIAMIEALGDLTPQHIMSYYKHAVSFYNDCREMKDIM